MEPDRRQRQQDSSAALALHEASTANVAGPREEPLGDPLVAHRLRIGGGVHVPKSDEGFDLEIVDGAGHHESRLASGDLINALFHGDTAAVAQAPTG